ncbi:MAG: hypothetical protein U0228_07945 [Myxococcaceae bacterium]
MSRRLTDLQLEKFLAQDLSPAERGAVEKVLAESKADADALRALENDSRAFLTSMPPAAFVEKVMPSPKPSAFRLWWGALAAAAVAAVLLVFFRTPGVDDDTRVKGDVAWKVMAGARSLGAGQSVGEGETLQFQVTTSEPRWVAVISHAPDGWFVYVPAVQVGAGVTPLAVGAKLDATKGQEVLFLVASKEALDAERVKAALSADQSVAGVTVEKLAFTKP